MSSAGRYGLALLVGAGGALGFLHGVLAPADGKSAAFAAVYLSLVAAACVGPFLDAKGVGAFGLGALVVCTVSGAFAPGLYVAFFAATVAVVGRSIYRPAVCVAALALLTTFFYWDEAFLFDAANRRESAALAFSLNPAAAASFTIGFDWMHAKALYSQSQTAESMFGVPLSGLGTCAARTAAVFVPFAGLVWWRERRA